MGGDRGFANPRDNPRDSRNLVRSRVRDTSRDSRGDERSPFRSLLASPERDRVTEGDSGNDGRDSPAVLEG
eukprot:518371-Amorphochlora_amoeboformis.AAC.1